VGQGSLSISQIRQSDEGRYVCTAKNIVGTRQSNTALLRVTRKSFRNLLLIDSLIYFLGK